ncbi:MAG: PAS domain S-box protein [Candidatus Helarchaeota archaeon]
MPNELRDKSDFLLKVEYINFLLNMFFESINDIVIIQDVNLNIIKANKATYRLARLYHNVRENEDIVGKPCHLIFHGNDVICAECPIKDALEKKRHVSVEHLDAKNNRWYNYLVYPIFNQNEVIAVAHFARDITDKKRLEEAIRKERETSERKFNNLIERSNDSIIIIQDGFIVFNNKKAVEMFGYSSEEMQGRPFQEFLAGDALIKKIMKIYEDRITSKGVPSLYEIKIKRKDGSFLDAEVSAGIVDWNGRPADLAIIRDISVRKKLENERYKSEEKYRKLIERSNDTIVIIKNGKIVFFNKKTNEVFGYQKEDIEGRLFTDFIATEEDINKLKKRYEDRIKGKNIPDLIEAKIRRKDGTIIDVEISGGLIEWDGDVANLAIIRDISERKRSEEKIIESEEKFRRIFEITPDLFFLISSDFRIVNFEGDPEQLFSLPENLRGSKIDDFLTGDLKKTAISKIKTLFETKEPQVFTFALDVKKEKRHYEARGFHFGKDLAGVFVRDITDQKNAEDELRRIHELNELILETVDLSINTADMKGRILTYNKGSEKIFGWKSEEVIGKEVAMFHPQEDRNGIIPRVLKNIKEKGKFEEILNLVRKNGEKFMASLVVKPIHDKNGKLIALLGIAKDLSPTSADIS